MQELTLDEQFYGRFSPVVPTESLLHKLTDALRSREALGTPALTSLRIKSNFEEDRPSDSAQAMRELLSLQCCSKLRHLSVDIRTSSAAYVDLLVSYIRRTECLESLEFTHQGYARDHFSPLAAVLSNEKPPNITIFKGVGFHCVPLTQLAELIESGGLPNRKELHLSCVMDGATATPAILLSRTLSPLLTSLSFITECYNFRTSDALTVLQAFLNGAFPNLRNLDIMQLDDYGADLFLSILRDAGVNSAGARTFRELSVCLNDYSFEELKALLPGAKVRRSI